MKAAADAHGALLSFGHQRRHLKLFQAVRQAVRDGEIGDLVMIEAQVGDMFDWGTHWLDMMFFYNEEQPAEWVIGQIDSRTEKRAFGAYMENQAVCHFKWKNGVRGILLAGYEASIGATHRLIGTEGVLEVLNERNMRLRGKGDAEWRQVEVPQGERSDHRLTALDVVRQLDEPGHRSFLNVDNAIQHTEVIFATYESSRYRGRIDLPLAPEDNALLALLEDGAIGPNRKA
jgi:predicted dehydrogenase